MESIQDLAERLAEYPWFISAELGAHGIIINASDEPIGVETLLDLGRNTYKGVGIRIRIHGEFANDART